MCFGIFRRGRGRAPTPPGVVGNASRLAITTQPPATARSGIPFTPTPVIQLQDAQGQNVALAGVEIVVVFVSGGAVGIDSVATIPGPNGGALTDSNGTATYTSFALEGVVGARQIQFDDFAAIYTPANTNPITIIAGAADATTTTATIPSGTVGQLTTITIQARDLSGNALTTGGDTVQVTISGANSFGPSPATDQGNGTYTFAYVPTASGLESIAITLNGVGIQGSPFARAVAPATPTVNSPRLRIGLANFTADEFGRGPGGNLGAPKYGAAVVVATASTIESIIDAADLNDVLVFVNFVGGRFSWTTQGTGTCRNYNPTSGPASTNYYGRLQAYSSANVGPVLFAKIQDALLRRRIVAYVVDEPFHNQFCNSISKTDVNQMARWHKDLFGRANVITCVRVCATRTDGQPAMDPPPSGGWTDVDYCWLQYEGTTHTPSANQTAVQFYAAQITVANTLGLGVILGNNWLDGGTTICWDYLRTGSSSGRIVGTFIQTGATFTAGQSITCATAVGTQSRFFQPPVQLQAVIDGIMANPTVRAASPCLMLWSHSPRGVEADSIFIPLEARPDSVTILDYCITQGDVRTTWAGWRTPK